jgi:hypothetical protein
MNFDEFVEELYKAGWRSPGDAQWTNIENLWDKLDAKRPTFVGPFMEIEMGVMQEVVQELMASLTPMVPYSADPLDFCRSAIEVKDKHVRKALELLPIENLPRSTLKE